MLAGLRGRVDYWALSVKSLRREEMPCTAAGELSPMRGRRDLVSTGLLGLLILLAADGYASPPRLRLERADARRCKTDHVIQVHAAEVSLDGVLRRRSPSEYRLLRGERVLAERPAASTTFAETGDALELALVMQQTSAYASSWSQIKGGAVELLTALPPHSAVSLISYDWEPRRLAVARPPAAVVRRLRSLAAGQSAADPALVAAIKLGLDGLAARGKTTRRLLVVLSDGLDALPDRDRFRGLGARAKHLEVPVFPIAFSPIDERGPLLNLGELAKRSFGTLRWARSAEQITIEAERLSREITQQLVLTYRVASCGQAGALHLAAGSLRSNPVEVRGSVGEASAPPAGLQRAPSWVVRILFILLLIGAFVALLLVARWLVRPRRRP
jgi:hypothetical protein